MYKIISILLIPAIILTGCSGLNTKNDYMQTTINLGSEDIERAVDFLPEGEGKTFITIMEKTYLNLLAGKPEISELAKYSRLIDNQVRYKISRGLKSFFFIENRENI